MATLLYRLGLLSVRHRWTAVIIWIVILAGVGTGALAFKGVFTSSFSIPGTPAQQALDQLRTEIPAAAGTAGRIVFAAPEGKTLADSAYAQAIGAVVKGTSGLPDVLAAIPPASGGRCWPRHPPSASTPNVTPAPPRCPAIRPAPANGPRAGSPW